MEEKDINSKINKMTAQRIKNRIANEMNNKIKGTQLNAGKKIYQNEQKYIKQQQEIQEQLEEVKAQKEEIQRQLTEAQQKTFSVLGQNNQQQQLPIYVKVDIGLNVPVQKVKERYSEQDAKENVLRYIRYGGHNYLEERQMQAIHGKKLPALSTVQKYFHDLLRDNKYYDANIGQDFDPTKHLRNIDIWKKNNKLNPQQMYKGCLQMDAVNINKQVTQNVSDGTYNNVMQDNNNNTVAISYFFAYILVLEVESKALPIFVQETFDGFSRDKQYETFQSIKNCLLKYNILIEKGAHDADNYWNRFEHYPIDLIQTNIAHNDKDPYTMLQDKYQVSSKPEYRSKQYRNTLVSIHDNRHLAKNGRNVLTFNLPLSISGKLDGKYITLNKCAHYIKYWIQGITDIWYLQSYKREYFCVWIFSTSKILPKNQNLSV
ncbi:Hypothetical_protein [Hexamita inflata]|uniref:Hypothetical_protein n=1 Tax=Hexamita inflata TaxID=28002 RepID=A0ABP1HL93_9EUKA